MKTTPISFGRAIKVNSTPEIAKLIAKSANVSRPTTDLDRFAKTIFSDTDVHKAKVVMMSDDEVYIFSGEEAEKQEEISKKLKQKIKENDDLIAQLPDRITRDARKRQHEVENFSRLNFAIFKMRNLVEDGLNCRPFAKIDVETQTLDSPLFGQYDEIYNAKYTSVVGDKTETLEYYI